MSAYGQIQRVRREGSCQLQPRTYRIPCSSSHGGSSSTSDQISRYSTLTVFPIQDVLVSAEASTANNNSRVVGLEGLWNHLSQLFDSIVLEGRTYPQEVQLGLDGFKNYFLSHDCFIGVLDIPATSRMTIESSELVLSEDDMNVQETDPLVLMCELIKGRPLGEIIAGMYYIKPNYPGRSAHCCNAGFVVDPKHRGRKIGKTLARSYLHYAPLLGYKASVFNLVYKNNLASIAIWDSLGFHRVGLIPKAGRLKSATTGYQQDPDQEAEEYVDAIVYWRELV